MEDESKAEVPELDLPVLNLLRQKYYPANSFADATSTPTTMQLLSEIYKHTGNAEVTIDSLYAWLVKEGYLDEMLAPGFEMVWLMKTPEDMGFGD